MRCSKCGKSLGEGEVFCPDCGIRVAGASTGRESPQPGEAEIESLATGKPVAPDGTSAGQAGDGPELTADSETAASAVPGSTVPPAPPEPGAPRGKTSGFSIASLILGIAGLLICPILASILAFIFGLFAKGEIRRGNGALKGSGMATAGITLGIIGIAIPVILAAVLVPLGVVFVKPELRAAARLLDGAAAARIYYFEHGDSYKRMRDTDLERIDDSVDFRVAPGKTADAVYIDSVADQSVRLYCYSSRGNRYTAVARRDQWRYVFRYWHGPMRWFDEWNHERLFD